MNQTATIQIGNSDNKLTQLQWSDFVKRVSNQLEHHTSHVHFAGGSSYDKPWQNACWVVEVTPQEAATLKVFLILIKNEFMQDSIAYTIGTTEFI